MIDQYVIDGYSDLPHLGGVPPSGTPPCLNQKKPKLDGVPFFLSRPLGPLRQTAPTMCSTHSKTHISIIHLPLL